MFRPVASVHDVGALKLADWMSFSCTESINLESEVGEMMIFRPRIFDVFFLLDLGDADFVHLDNCFLRKEERVVDIEKS